MATDTHASVIGMGLMGCDIAAIFLSAGWRVDAVETNKAVWEKARDRVRSSLVQLDSEPARVAGLTRRWRRCPSRALTW